MLGIYEGLPAFDLNGFVLYRVIAKEEFNNKENRRKTKQTT